jgi:hypothetical protein
LGGGEKNGGEAGIYKFVNAYTTMSKWKKKRKRKQKEEKNQITINTHIFFCSFIRLSPHLPLLFLHPSLSKTRLIPRQ